MLFNIFLVVATLCTVAFPFLFRSWCKRDNVLADIVHAHWRELHQVKSLYFEAGFRTANQQDIVLRDVPQFKFWEDEEIRYEPDKIAFQGTPLPEQAWHGFPGHRHEVDDPAAEAAYRQRILAGRLATLQSARVGAYHA